MSFWSTFSFLQLLRPRQLKTIGKIRIGPDTDGGYILADALRPEQVVFSYGLSWNVGFDFQLAQMNHTVHMFDHTIDGLPVEHPNFQYHKQGVAGVASADGQLDTLDNHFLRYAEGKSIILKIDVEGAEWEAIEAVSEANLSRVEQIVVEVHDLRRCAEDQFRAQVSRVFQKINRLFHLIHVHANNCAPIIVVDGFAVADVLELTYVNQKIFATQESRELYPTEIDGPNDPARDDFPLWFFPFVPWPGLRESDVYGRDAIRLRQQGQLHQVRDQLRSATPSAPSLRTWEPLGPRARGALKILILSVHPVLEYDDILMFEQAGHRVFSLGFYSVRSDTQSMRPMLDDTDWHRSLFNILEADGAATSYQKSRRWTLGANFVSEFDVVIVHHDVDFLSENWDVLARKPIIWRGIGQESIESERKLADFRRRGVRIVRWSPVQRDLSGYAGADAVIRACKDPAELEGWVGDTPTIVTFANDFTKRRDSLAYDFWARCVEPFDCELFGLRNDDLPQWKGELSYGEQKRKLREARVALVTGSRPAPYTLSFVEAWMTGIPVVHLGAAVGSASPPGSWEISELIQNGVNGFVVNDVEEAQRAISFLLGDHDLAARISEAGRRSAVEAFGIGTIAQSWRNFLVDVLS